MPTRFVTATGSSQDADNQLADDFNQVAGWADNAAAAGTIVLTAAQMVNASHRITSGAASTVTGPSAASIVALLKNAQVGSEFDFWVINGGSGTYTLSGGTGMTYVGFVSPVTLKSQAYKGVVTNATLGAEAVTLIGLGSAGF